MEKGTSLLVSPEASATKDPPPHWKVDHPWKGWTWRRGGTDTCRFLPGTHLEACSIRWRRVWMEYKKGWNMLEWNL